MSLVSAPACAVAVSTPLQPTSRLMAALVERWVGLDTPPDADPRLSLWSYDADGATLHGRWTASARVVARADPWLCTDVVRRLAGPLRSDPVARAGALLVWERPGLPRVRQGDLAWYAASRTVDLGPRGDAALVAVTRTGWVSVPDGTIGRRPRRSR